MNRVLFLVLFLFSFNLNADYLEEIEFLNCDNLSNFDNDFIYPVNIFGFSSFPLNQKHTIYQLNLLIDFNFRFPKVKLEDKFIPFSSKKEKITCYTDIKPDNLYLLYENAKGNKNSILFLEYKKDGFYLNIDEK